MLPNGDGDDELTRFLQGMVSDGIKPTDGEARETARHVLGQAQAAKRAGDEVQYCYLMLAVQHIITGAQLTRMEVRISKLENVCPGFGE